MNITINWREISQQPGLSEEFMLEHEKQVDWYWISRRQHLSEMSMENLQDFLDWEAISEYQTLSESFIDRFQDKLNWNIISSKQILSEPFIEKHIEHLDWVEVCKHQDVSLSFLQKYIHRIPLHWLESNTNLVFTRQEYTDLERAYSNYWLPKIHIHSLSYHANKDKGGPGYKASCILRSKAEKPKHIDFHFSAFQHSFYEPFYINYTFNVHDKLQIEDVFSSDEEKHAFEYLLNVFLIKHMKKIAECSATYELVSSL